MDALLRKDFAGKTAFVTGAAGGLGQAIASAFAEQGAAVALADLPARTDELEALSRRMPLAPPWNRQPLSLARWTSWSATPA
jgi:NAD(P)-dependent dehydrogenase (short-subunit alcohol dehydrogenase family)